MNVKIFIFGTFLFFILSSNCAVKLKEIDFTSREFSVEELKKELSNNSRLLKTLIGNGVILFETKEYFEKANAEIYIKFPDSIMVKLEGPLGLDLAYIFFSERELKYYNIRENLKYIGKYDSDKLKNLMGTKLKFVEILELLGGIFNPNIISSNEMTEVLARKEEYIIISEIDEGMEEYFIDKKIWNVKKYIKLNKNKEIVLEKKFNNFKRFIDFFVPRVIRYTIPDERITLIYTSIKINERIDSSKFKIKIPESAEEIIL